MTGRGGDGVRKMENLLPLIIDVGEDFTLLQKIQYTVFASKQVSAQRKTESEINLRYT